MGQKEEDGEVEEEQQQEQEKNKNKNEKKRKKHACACMSLSLTTMFVFAALNSSKTQSSKPCSLARSMGLIPSLSATVTSPPREISSCNVSSCKERQGGNGRRGEERRRGGEKRRGGEGGEGRRGEEGRRGREEREVKRRAGEGRRGEEGKRGGEERGDERKGGEGRRGEERRDVTNYYCLYDMMIVIMIRRDNFSINHMQYSARSNQFNMFLHVLALQHHALVSLPGCPCQTPLHRG